MIVVVGGGPAGRYAAMRLAGAGKEVTLVDRRVEGLGGQCLHQGCMIICALNDLARTLDQAARFREMGIVSGSLTVSYPVLIRELRTIITTIAGVLDRETIDAGVRVITGEAVVNGRAVRVNGETIPADKLILACGARPNIPDIPGKELDGVYTAHTILSMATLPKRLVIIGGGVIAAEFAYIFASLGTTVTMIVRSTLLHQIPETLVQQAKKDLDRVKIIEEATVREITRTGSVSGVSINGPGGEELIPCEAVLIATGMTPDTGFIAGIEKNADGSIRVSDHLETSVPGVYAAGDVTGNGFLTPVARRYGRLAADIILGHVPMPMPVAIPQAIKLKNDLGWCHLPGFSGKGVSIPGPAGPGTFWSVPERHTGVTSLSTDNTGKICSMAEASPVAATAAAYAGWMINAGIRVQDLESFYEVHPSSDGIYWLARYLADRS